MNETISKDFLKKAALFLFPLYAVYSGIFLVCEIFKSNWVLLNSIWYNILDFLRILSEPLILSVLFGFLIFGIAVYGIKHCRALYILCGSALLFKYLGMLTCVSVLNRSLDLTADYSASIVSFLTEAGIAAVLVFYAHFKITQKQEENFYLARAAAKNGKEFDQGTDIFPFKKIFSLQNVLQKSAFFVSVLLGIIRLFNFIMDDIFSPIEYEISDLPFTFLYIFLEVLLPAALGYFVIIWLLTKFCQKSTK